MSSHHIIREKQEPALLVLGMDNFDDELLGQLLEWSPTVMVTQEIAEKLNAYGLKVDCIIADNINDDVQSDVKILPVNEDSIISTALKYLTANNYPAVNVVTDDFAMHDYLPYADKINLVIFYNKRKIYPITSGFGKWKPAGEIIELLSNPTNLQYTGLDPLSDTTFKTQQDGLFTLQFNERYIVVAESL